MYLVYYNYSNAGPECQDTCCGMKMNDGKDTLVMYRRSSLYVMIITGKTQKNHSLPTSLCKFHYCCYCLIIVLRCVNELYIPHIYLRLFFQLYYRVSFRYGYWPELISPSLNFQLKGQNNTQEL